MARDLSLQKAPITILLILPGDKFDIFLSHSWYGESDPVSQDVKKLLEKEKIRVWYDRDQMKGDLDKVKC